MGWLVGAQKGNPKIDYKMQQVSVWIEHRYATTEIGINLKNLNPDAEEVVVLSYDLKQSDYIHDLHGKCQI